MIDNKISIKGDAVVDIQRGAIGHRATWTGLTYTHACKAGKVIISRFQNHLFS